MLLGFGFTMAPQPFDGIELDAESRSTVPKTRSGLSFRSWWQGDEDPSKERLLKLWEQEDMCLKPFVAAESQYRRLGSLCLWYCCGFPIVYLLGFAVELTGDGWEYLARCSTALFLLLVAWTLPLPEGYWGLASIQNITVLRLWWWTADAGVAIHFLSGTSAGQRDEYQYTARVLFLACIFGPMGVACGQQIVRDYARNLFKQLKADSRVRVRQDGILHGWEVKHLVKQNSHCGAGTSDDPNAVLWISWEFLQWPRRWFFSNQMDYYESSVQSVEGFWAAKSEVMARVFAWQPGHDSGLLMTISVRQTWLSQAVARFAGRDDLRDDLRDAELAERLQRHVARVFGGLISLAMVVLVLFFGLLVISGVPAQWPHAIFYPFAFVFALLLPCLMLVVYDKWGPKLVLEEATFGEVCAGCACRRACVRLLGTLLAAIFAALILFVGLESVGDGLALVGELVLVKPPITNGTQTTLACLIPPPPPPRVCLLPCINDIRYQNAGLVFDFGYVNGSINEHVHSSAPFDDCKSDEVEAAVRALRSGYLFLGILLIQSLVNGLVLWSFSRSFRRLTEAAQIYMWCADNQQVAEQSAVVRQIRFVQHVSGVTARIRMELKEKYLLHWLPLVAPPPQPPKPEVQEAPSAPSPDSMDSDGLRGAGKVEEDPPASPESESASTASASSPAPPAAPPAAPRPVGFAWWFRIRAALIEETQITWTRMLLVVVAVLFMWANYMLHIGLMSGLSWSNMLQVFTTGGPAMLMTSGLFGAPLLVQLAAGAMLNNEIAASLDAFAFLGPVTNLPPQDQRYLYWARNHPYKVGLGGWSLDYRMIATAATAVLPILLPAATAVLVKLGVSTSPSR